MRLLYWAKLLRLIQEELTPKFSKEKRRKEIGAKMLTYLSLCNQFLSPFFFYYSPQSSLSYQTQGTNTLHLSFVKTNLSPLCTF